MTSLLNSVPFGGEEHAYILGIIRELEALPYNPQTALVHPSKHVRNLDLERTRQKPLFPPPFEARSTPRTWARDHQPSQELREKKERARREAGWGMTPEERAQSAATQASRRKERESYRHQQRKMRRSSFLKDAKAAALQLLPTLIDSQVYVEKTEREKAQNDASSSTLVKPATKIAVYRELPTNASAYDYQEKNEYNITDEALIIVRKAEMTTEAQDAPNHSAWGLPPDERSHSEATRAARRAMRESQKHQQTNDNTTRHLRGSAAALLIFPVEAAFSATKDVKAENASDVLGHLDEGKEMVAMTRGDLVRASAHQVEISSEESAQSEATGTTLTVRKEADPNRLQKEEAHAVVALGETFSAIKQQDNLLGSSEEETPKKLLMSKLRAKRAPQEAPAAGAKATQRDRYRVARDAALAEYKRQRDEAQLVLPG
jgi:hypothetical protein